jgi:nucleoprotein TPR
MSSPSDETIAGPPSSPTTEDAGTQARKASAALTSKVMLEELERQYVQIKGERDDLQQELTAAEEKFKTLNESLTSNQALEVENAARQHELRVAQERVKALEEEQTATKERTDRAQAESDRLREEIARLAGSNRELSENIATFEVQSKLSESQAIPLFHEKQRLQTELDSLQAHAHWLEQELTAKSQDYQKLQRESRDRSIQLQLQLDQTINEKEAFEARLDELHKMERRLQDKVEELSHDLLTGKQAMTDLQESTEIEIREERRLVQLQKTHLDRWEHRYNDVVRENESLKKAATEAMETSRSELLQTSEALENKYKDLLREQAAEYEEKLKSNRLEAGPVRLALPAPPAAVATDYEDDVPLNLTDLYTRLEETKATLRRETARADRAELLNERIQKDIAAKAPLLNRQREEYDFALDQIQNYQRRLEQALNEVDNAREDSKETRRDANRLQKLLSERTSESKELAKQVQALLVTRAGGQVGEEIPTSIVEIQNQNQRLLAEHRRLTETVRELESKLESDTLKAQLDAVEAELADLREDRQRQETTVERIVQQRDLYRAILSKQDANVLGSESEQLSAMEIAKQQSERYKALDQKSKTLASDLAAARGEIDRMGRERESMVERLARYEAHSAEMKAAVDTLERELLSARGDAARSNSESLYHRERAERVEESLQRARDEISMIGSSKAELQRINTDLQQRVDIVRSESSRVATEVRQAEMKARLAETQVETAKASESRMAEEVNQLRGEVSRQGSIIESIRRIEASLSAKSGSEREVLKSELEKLSQVHKSEQTSFNTKIENLNARIQEMDSRVVAANDSKDKFQSELSSVKDELNAVTAEKQELNLKARRLEAQLRAAKKKLGEGDDLDDVEVALQARIEHLTNQLEETKSELANSKKQADTYQLISKNAESALAELSQATETMKAANESEVLELNGRLEKLQKENASKQEIVLDLTKDLLSQRGEQEKVESILKSEIESLKSEMKTREQDSESSIAGTAALKLDLDAMRTEVATAQGNYERELQLHSQARTALREAREQAQEETRLRQIAEEKTDASAREFDQQKNVWEQEKLSTNENAKMIEESLKEAREQNRVLHMQLESLGAMVEESQMSRAVAASEIPEPGNSSEQMNLQKMLSELREILKFVRSENEILQTQLDTAKRAADRERTTFQVVKRSLDEARAELKSLQNQDIMDKDLPGNNSAEQLRDAVEQLTLLRDSNKLLRDNADKLQSNLTATQNDLNALKSSREPAEKVQRELEARIASAEAEKESLNRDLAAWKSRVESLLSKFNQIDPEEYEKVLRQVEELTKEKESLNAWKKTTEAENTRIREICRNLKKHISELKKTIEEQKKDIDKLTTEKATLTTKSTEGTSAAKERDELKGKLSQAEKDTASTKTELDGANHQNEILRERMRQMVKTSNELRKKERELVGQLAEAKSATQTDSIQDKLGKPSENASEKRTLASSKIGISTPAFSATTPESTQRTAGLADVRAPQILPTIPTNGFRFGPSTKPKPKSPMAVSEDVLQAKSEETIETRGASELKEPTSVFSEKAPEFVPHSQMSTKTETTISSTSGSSPLQSGGIVADAKQRSSGELATTTHAAPSESQELSMKKEKLLEKKRLLADAKKRKIQAEAEARKADTDGLQQVAKKPKTEDTEKESRLIGAEVGDRTLTAGTMSEQETSNSAEVLLEADKTESELVEVENLDNEEPSKSEVAENETEPAFKPSFFGNGSTATASPFTKSNPATPFGRSDAFGQSATVLPGAPTTFGVTSSTVQSSSGFGEAFLSQMKPPGSSATPPIFSFGSSEIPGQQFQASASVFGSFVGKSSLGSRAGSKEPSMAAFPFASQPAVQENKEQNDDAKDANELEQTEEDVVR